MQGFRASAVKAPSPFLRTAPPAIMKHEMRPQANGRRDLPSKRAALLALLTSPLRLGATPAAAAMPSFAVRPSNFVLTPFRLGKERGR